MIHSKKFIISVLFTTPLFGMEYKERLHKYLDRVRTCNLQHIQTIPAQALNENPEEFLDTVVKCPNIEEIIQSFDQIIDPKGKKKFAHRYNEEVRKEKQIWRNFFFEKVMYRQ